MNSHEVPPALQEALLATANGYAEQPTSRAKSRVRAWLRAHSANKAIAAESSAARLGEW